MWTELPPAQPSQAPLLRTSWQDRQKVFELLLPVPTPHSSILFILDRAECSLLIGHLLSGPGFNPWYCRQSTAILARTVLGLGQYRRLSLWPEIYSGFQMQHKRPYCYRLQVRGTVCSDLATRCMDGVMDSAPQGLMLTVTLGWCYV